MHATLRVGDRNLMASDFPPGMAGNPQQAVTNSHEANSDAEARRILAVLGKGGTEIMACQATFWSDGFGTFKDRFGTYWMISSPARSPG